MLASQEITVEYLNWTCLIPLNNPLYQHTVHNNAEPCPLHTGVNFNCSITLSEDWPALLINTFLIPCTERATWQVCQGFLHTAECYFITGILVWKLWTTLSFSRQQLDHIYLGLTLQMYWFVACYCFVPCIYVALMDWKCFRTEGD